MPLVCRIGTSSCDAHDFCVCTPQCWVIGSFAANSRKACCRAYSTPASRLSRSPVQANCESVLHPLSVSRFVWFRPILVTIAHFTVFRVVGCSMCAACVQCRTCMIRGGINKCKGHNVSDGSPQHGIMIITTSSPAKYIVQCISG